MSASELFSLVAVVWLVLIGAIVSYVNDLRRSQKHKRVAYLQPLDAAGSQGVPKKVVGFFHPYCNAGGGGERVLWAAVALIQRTEPDVVSVVYSGDTDANKEQILAKIKARFDIELDPHSLQFVFLKSRWLVEDSTWPRFTLLGQCLGSMWLAREAMLALMPDLFIDTMGYAFSFHVVAWLCGCPIGAYIHYPIISTDMLVRVQSRRLTYANRGDIASSSILSRGKLFYYRLLMHQYAAVLRRAQFIMTNSTWTKNHIQSIVLHQDPLLDTFALLMKTAALPITLPLKMLTATYAVPSPSKALPRIVYPPCDTHQFMQFGLEQRERIIMSLAQFRPEKDHATQLLAFAHLLETHPEYRDGDTRARLVLIGGSRNDGDTARVEALRAQAVKLKIESQVEFVVNAPFPDMLRWLSRAGIGVNTMIDEHFGINVVEFMAAGLIPVAHASAGPLLDIIVPFDGQPTGFHATTADTFANAFHAALTLPKQAELDMRERARALAAQKFSTASFEAGWNASGWKSWLSR